MKTNNTVTTITKRNDERITRPLRTLVPLIKSDLAKLENSGKPYRYSIGKKLVEASQDHQGLKKAGGWKPWLKQNFTMAYDTAENFMDFYKSQQRKANRQGSRSATFATQEDESEAYAKFAKKGDRHRHGKAQSRSQTIGAIVGGIDADIYAQKLQDRYAEVELRRDLAGKLVEAGYRLLAKELHPDKGGTDALMRRLKAVKEALIELVPMIGSEVTL